MGIIQVCRCRQRNRTGSHVWWETTSGTARSAVTIDAVFKAGLKALSKIGFTSVNDSASSIAFSVWPGLRARSKSSFQIALFICIIFITGCASKRGTQAEEQPALSVPQPPPASVTGVDLSLIHI